MNWAAFLAKKNVHFGPARGQKNLKGKLAHIRMHMIHFLAAQISKNFAEMEMD